MSAERLTPKRLFSAPPLTGSTPQDLKFTPDGSGLTYLRAADDDRERMDLWRIDLADLSHHLWVDGRTLATDADVASLTAAERAERERRRRFHHGVTEYDWHPDGSRLLLPADGRALLLTPGGDGTWLCPTGTRQSGFTLDPQGQRLSYVRGGDLYVWDVLEGTEKRLTEDASDTLSNGLPDFLAAEEMHRFAGHWWSSDGASICYCKVDESTVAVSHRLEMEADGARTIEQRYPYAGAENPRVALWRVDLTTGEHACLWQCDGAEAYLARVTMGDNFALLQIQDRLQQRLTLRRIELASGEARELYTETVDTWINLSDDLKLLDDGTVLLSSEQSGTRQVYALGKDGAVQAIPCPTHVNAVHGCHDDAVFVSGWQESPTENHLFRLAGGAVEQLTQAAGWHDVALDVTCTQYLDRYSSPDVLVEVSVASLSAQTPPRQIHAEVVDGEHPYAPYLASHVMSQFGEIAAADGQRLCYRLTPPARIDGQHATIVYVYGGPGAQKVRRDWGSLLVQMFAHYGFAVLEVDNRGSGNRGHTFEAPIYRQLGEVEVVDQLEGLTVLREQPWADLNRVGIFGHSYGGYMTLMCMSKAPSAFAAGVAVAPVSDWQLYDTHYTERYMGLPADNAAGYEAANVLPHLHNLNAPLLLMHGMADDNVLFTNSTLLMGKLQDLGIPFDLMTYPGAKHSMQEQSVSVHRFEMILSFFARHLQQGHRQHG